MIMADILALGEAIRATALEIATDRVVLGEFLKSSGRACRRGSAKSQDAARHAAGETVPCPTLDA